MICKIDNTTVPEYSFTMPTMNFGQTWRYEEYKKVTYEIHISIQEFKLKTQQWFKQFKIESIEDIEIDSKNGFIVQIQYAKLGFPCLEKMIASHIYLLGDIIKDNDLDLLNLLLNEFSNEGNNPFYLINSLDLVKIESGLVFTGVAFLIDS